MKLPNLKELMISITDVKQQLSEVINKKMTKIIIKNNEPVSIVMPYDDYVKLTEGEIDRQNTIEKTGQDITLENGIQLKVCVEKEGGLSRDGIIVKTYIKMKSSGEYKLHHTLSLGSPSVEESMTTDEIIQRYKFNNPNS